MTALSLFTRGGNALALQTGLNHKRRPGGVTSDDEQALMNAYVRGDKGAFDRLFALLAPRLLGFFRRATRDRELADDMLQITFERLHAARERYQPGAPLRPWLFTIAARVRIDELRRRYRLPRSVEESELDNLAELQPLPEQLGSEQNQRDAQVRAAIDALPPSQRVIVHLHRFENLTFREIADVLGSTEGAVRIKAFRAYEKLRVSLSSLHDGELHE